MHVTSDMIGKAACRWERIGGHSVIHLLKMDGFSWWKKGNACINA